MDDGAVGVAVIGQLQTEQRLTDGMTADVQRPATEPRSPTLPGIITLAGSHLIDDAKQNLMATAEGYADTVGRIFMDEVRRAVERVDYPAVLLVMIDGRPFLGDEARLGQQFAKCRDDEPLRAFIDIRHVVVSVLALHHFFLKLPALLSNIGPGPSRHIADGTGKLFQLHHLTLQTLSTMPLKPCEKLGAQRKSELFNQPYLLSAGASNWGAQRK